MIAVLDMSIIDRVEYPELALSVNRGGVGVPSIVTLDWVADMADGSQLECKLVLDCTLALNLADGCRELTITSIGGDDAAVTEFRLWATLHRSMTQIDDTKTWVEDERMEDTALALGRSMLLPDLHNQHPRLLVKVVQ